MRSITGSFQSIGYNFTRAASLVAEWALDRSGSTNGHLTSPRNGHLTFRKTGPGGPPLKRGSLGRGQAVRRLTLDQEIEGSNPSSPATPRLIRCPITRLG